MPPRFLTDAQMAELEAQQAQQPRKFITDAEMAELEAQYSQASSTPKMTGAEKATAFGGQLLKGLTLGLGDEIIAGGSGLIDYATGKAPSLSDAYSSRKAQVDNLLSGFKEENPFIAGGTEFVSSLASPAVGLKTAGLLGKGVTKLAPKLAKTGTILNNALTRNVAKGAIAGATEAGIYAGNEGKNIKEAMTTGGTLGGGLGAVTGGVSKVLSGANNAGRAMQRSAIGITPADLRKAEKGIGRFERTKTGQNPLINAFESIKKRGEFPKVFEPDVLRNKGVAEITSKGSKVTEIISKADEVLDDAVIPTFNKAQKYIEKLAGSEKGIALKALEKEVSALNTQLDGTLTGLQKAKVAFNKKAYSVNAESYQKGLDRAITRDLKEAIEGKVSSLTEQGKLKPAYKNAIDKLNGEIGEWENLLEPIQKMEAKVDAQDPTKSFLQAIRTSGGVGTIGPVAGALTGGAGGAVLGGLGAYGIQKGIIEPTGRYKTGELLQKLPNSLDGIQKGLSKLSGYTGKEVAQDLSILPSEASNQNTNIPKAEQPKSSSKVISGNNSNISSKLYPKKMDVSLKSLIDQQDPLVKAIIKQESNFNPRAGSKAGARGLMQIMPFWDDKLGINDPFDPEQNINAGIEIYNRELDRFKDPVLALASYNAGSPAVNRAIKKAGSRQWSKVKKYLPAETRAYPSKVLKYYREFEGETA